MPLYEFTSDAGGSEERFYNMSDERPDTIEIDAYGRERHLKNEEVLRTDDGFDGKPEKILRRNFGGSRANCMEHAQYPYASLRLKGRIDASDAQCVNTNVRGIDHKDVPIVRSKKHEDQIAKKYGLVRE